jgi:hypothetical protein
MLMVSVDISEVRFERAWQSAAKAFGTSLAHGSLLPDIA